MVGVVGEGFGVGAEDFGGDYFVVMHSNIVAWSGVGG